MSEPETEDWLRVDFFLLPLILWNKDVLFYYYVLFFLCWNCLSLFCSWFVVYNKEKIIFLLSLFLIWFQYPFLSKMSFQSSLLLITFLTMRHFLKYVLLSYNLKPPIFTSLLFTTSFKLLDHYHMRCTENIKHYVN